ncbi:MAG: glycosyltransferase [Fimbriimonadaceae bacterium]
MRLAVTGGGTGGHVFPAIEVGLAARASGCEVAYFGSQRGIEGAQAARVNFPFHGFPSEPLYRLASPRGLKSAARMAIAMSRALRSLQEERIERMFSSGGYASAPVVHAARKLGIPYVLHEQNSVPGRTNVLLSAGAEAVCTVFESAARHFPRSRVERTGMPVRGAFRSSGQGRLPTAHSLESASPIVLVVGGSQGSIALNDMAVATAVRMATTPVHWLHLTGTTHFESSRASLERMAVKGPYEIKAYLDEADMAAAMLSAHVVVCRSGAGTLAELAALRKPSVLVPYPKAFGDHQTENAKEFEQIGAADLLPQDGLSATTLEARIQAWLDDGTRVRSAESALAQWDIPDAIERTLNVVLEKKLLAGALR